jgi:hypothetical protein
MAPVILTADEDSKDPDARPPFINQEPKISSRSALQTRLPWKGRLILPHQM